MGVWSDTIEPHIRSRLAETTATGFWTSRDLQRYFNHGQSLQHSIVFQAASKLEAGGFSQAYENDWLKLFLEYRQFTIHPEQQDYELPSNFWRMARVVIGASPPRQAAAVAFGDDYQVRLGGRMGPTSMRPLYGIVPHTFRPKLRVYVSPGDKTVPIAPQVCFLHYFRKPTEVDLSASPPIDAEVGDVALIAAPVAWACYQAFLKERKDGTVFRDEFTSHVQALVPGPSPETRV